MNIQKYLDLFEYQKDEKSENPRLKAGFWSFKSECFTGSTESEGYRTMSDIIHNSGLDEESAYTFTVEALQTIKEISEQHTASDAPLSEQLEDLEIVVQYKEAPIDNSELTEWMAQASNYTFVEDAINELGWDNSSMLGSIAYGYLKAWQVHYFEVLEAVK